MLDMQYELVRDRGWYFSEDMPSMDLLYLYSKYKKDREAAKPKSNTVKIGRNRMS